LEIQTAAAVVEHLAFMVILFVEIGPLNGGPAGNSGFSPFLCLSLAFRLEPTWLIES
jgi:hypothetical protein